MSKTVTTVLMWIFTVLLFLGLLIIAYPIISTCFFPVYDSRSNAICKSATVSMPTQTAIFSLMLMVIGFFGSMITGIATTKGKETFKRMYSI